MKPQEDGGVKALFEDLWRDKPLVITVLVAMVALIYILYKNGLSGLSAPAAPVTPPAPVGGTFYNTYTTNSTIITTEQAAAPVPPMQGAPIAAPVTPAQPAPPPAPKQQTYTVTEWPSPGSSLFSIAQIVYGNGNLWETIYNANKSKIGNNPNLIYKGMVLVIPPKP
jgi:hypothetical protein